MNTQPLSINGALGIARRVRMDAYAQYRPYIVTAWLIDADHLLPPYRQWVVSVAQSNKAGLYALAIAGIAPPMQDDDRLCTVDRLDEAYVLGAALHIYEFRTDPDSTVPSELCARLVGDIVSGTIYLTMSENAWRLYMSGVASQLLGRPVQ